MSNSKAITVRERFLHSTYLLLVCAWIALLWASSQFSRSESRRGTSGRKPVRGIDAAGHRRPHARHGGRRYDVRAKDGVHCKLVQGER